MGKPESKEDNIKTNHQEMGWRGLESIDLVQDTNPWWAVSLLVKELFFSQELFSLCSMKLVK